MNAPQPGGKSADRKTVLIIGAGIAGLSAGIYAQMNGYDSRIYELHTQPGGLVTAWKRKGYTIDGCIHWLTGSAPGNSFYDLWQEIGLIQNRQIFDPEIFSRFEGRKGEVLNLYTDINRLEQHLLDLAPEDTPVIKEMCDSVRSFAGFEMPSDVSSMGDFIKMLPKMPKMITLGPRFQRWGKLTMSEFAARFKNPFLRETFGEMWYPEMSAMGLLFTLAILHTHQAGYPQGGSLPMAIAVAKRYCDLGGDIVYGARVQKILVEPLPGGQGSRAAGIVLADGAEQRADIVISAADGHATIFDMLEGRFISDKQREMYGKWDIFQPLVFIGLGVNRTFDDFPKMTSGVSIALDEPVQVAGKPVKRLEYQIYNFDPSLAPAGKTAITCMITTNYAYWKELSGEPERYEAEKERIGLEVINRLDRRFPGIAGQVEMADVATPLTFERYTGNWQGSFEGWLPTPKTMMTRVEYTLPNLEDFYMIGQWVQPGGGLPTGVMTGRAVVKMMCKKEKRKFRAVRE